MSGLLDGEKVSLTLVSKEGLTILHYWFNDPKHTGEYKPLLQITHRELEKRYLSLGDESWWFIKDRRGFPVGFLSNQLRDGCQTLSYLIEEEERGNGYATEAVHIIVDYLFLNRDIVRIQAETDPRNKANIRVLQKNGFACECVKRKSFFSRGIWTDSALYSILREEWKGPHYKW